MRHKFLVYITFGLLFTCLSLQAQHKSKTWKTYHNKDYHFSLLIPPNSSFYSTSHGYIRFQNYSNRIYIPGLKKGQYYLEISFERNSTISCKEDIENPKAVQFSGLKGYIGIPKIMMDAGGYRKMLCLKSPQGQLTISVTEGDKKMPIINKILGSFRYKK
ncbi:hypothetical protein BKI52_40845 [marine bacterium AO1-C]|nr:hypothetical protein BKI52_40845 [marine bacterium AO1-C]